MNGGNTVLETAKVHIDVFGPWRCPSTPGNMTDSEEQGDTPSPAQGKAKAEGNSK